MPVIKIKKKIKQIRKIAKNRKRNTGIASRTAEPATEDITVARRKICSASLRVMNYEV
tara:strand:+ start:4274 stop:4447 length:174 start_codon:yes stop_codon:yes gene_type:complete